MPADDDATLDAFVQSAGRRLLRAAWLLTGNWQAAEDLVQLALEKTWPRWSTLTDVGHRMAYPQGHDEVVLAERAPPLDW